MAEVEPGSVDEIDHVFVHVRRPDRFFALFTDVLGLPVSWPLADYGPIVSAGVNLGDASLEFLRFPRLARLLRFAPSVGGLAFTVASLDAAIARLRDLGFSARRTSRAHRESADGYDDVAWVGASCEAGRARSCRSCASTATILPSGDHSC